MRKALYLPWILFLHLSPAADTLSLQGAVREALANHFGIVLAKNQIRMAENTRSLASAGMLPTLDASGNYTWTRKDAEQDPPVPANPNGVTTSRSAGAQIALNWTIFDGLRMFKAYDQVHTSADLNAQNARAQIESAVAQVIQAYWNLSAQQLAWNILKNQLDLSRERARRQQQRQESGSISSREFLKAQVDLNADSARLMDQELALRLAQNQLNLALGRTADQPIYASDSIALPAQIADSSAWLSAARENNPELKAARLKIQVADLNLGIQKSRYWPTISLGASHGYSDVSNTLPTNAEQEIRTWQTQIGLTARWNLFNGFQDRVNIQNSAIEAQNARTELRRKEISLENQVLEQMERARQAIAKASFEESAVELSRQNFRAAEEQYKLGQQSAMEFREAQQQLASAEFRLIQARLQAKLAISELERLCGRLNIP